jgi:hypothetical protein
VVRECFLESAEQAGLRWRSTVRQQGGNSCRQFVFHVCQDLLDDYRVFNAGNDLGCTPADSTLLNADVENPPACLAMKSATIIDDSYSKVRLASTMQSKQTVVPESSARFILTTLSARYIVDRLE